MPNAEARSRSLTHDRPAPRNPLPYIWVIEFRPARKQFRQLNQAMLPEVNTFRTGCLWQGDNGQQIHRPGSAHLSTHQMMPNGNVAAAYVDGQFGSGADCDAFPSPSSCYLCLSYRFTVIGWTPITVRAPGTPGHLLNSTNGSDSAVHGCQHRTTINRRREFNVVFK